MAEAREISNKSDARYHLSDVFDSPKPGDYKYEEYQKKAREYIRDGETLTWTVKSFCRRKMAFYTATRTGDLVSVTRTQESFQERDLGNANLKTLP